MDKELKTLYRIQDDQVMDVVIANLETKLAEARKRKPLVDYRENEEIIRALKAYRYNYIELNEEKTFLSYADGVLSGEVVIDRPWSEVADQWNYKAGQIGRKGEKGDIGFGFIEVRSTTFNDDHLRSKEAFVAFRKGGARNDVFAFRTSLFSKNCVTKLSLKSGSEVSAPIFQDDEVACLLAVKKTTEECKNITRYCFVHRTLQAWTRCHLVLLLLGNLRI